MDVEQVRQIERQQRKICRRCSAEFCPAPFNLKVGIAVGIREGVWPRNGLRHPPEGGTTGWYLWAGTEFSEDPDFFKPFHVGHLYKCNSAVLKYLGLAPGWRFLLAADYEDVWYDETLLAV